MLGLKVVLKGLLDICFIRFLLLIVFVVFVMVFIDIGMLGNCCGLFCSKFEFVFFLMF